MSLTIGRARLQVGVTALVVAGGSGRRMGTETPKQFLPLSGVPVLVHTLRLFAAEPQVDEILIVAPPEWLVTCTELVAEYGISRVTRVVPGGAERQDSVYAGLCHCTSRPRVVAVHDAVRPLLPPELLTSMLAAAASYPALAMAIPATDTVKEATDPGVVWAGHSLPRVTRTPPRSSLWLVQTPQVYWADVLVSAYRRAQDMGLVATDCAGLVEAMGEPVYLFPGVAENIKLTGPHDFHVAEAILAGR